MHHGFGLNLIVIAASSQVELKRLRTCRALEALGVADLNDFSGDEDGPEGIIGDSSAADEDWNEGVLESARAEPSLNSKSVRCASRRPEGNMIFCFV